MSATQRRLCTPPEAADQLGVPVDTLRRWRLDKRGPAYIRVGRHVRYADQDIDSWIATQRVNPEPRGAA